MKKTISLFCVIILGSLSQISFAQIKPLNIGDTLPATTLPEILNFPLAANSTGAFKGKLLILDFWATWCSPCVAMLPKTDSLQKIFGDKVQFLPVSQESKKTVEAFLKRLNREKKVTVPSIYTDTLLNSLFIHSSLPYYVWIGPNGKVIATTEQSEITQTNIEKVLKGQQVSMTIREGALKRDINRKKPIFIVGIPFIGETGDTTNVEPIQQRDVIYQSVVTKYVPNLQLHVNFDSTHFVATDVPPLNIYQMFYGATTYHYMTHAFFSKSRYKIEVKDSILRNRIRSNEIGQKYVNWLKDNGYCYELIWKNAKNWPERWSFLREDLDRYFAKPLGITVDIEKRMAPSDVLIVQNVGKLKTTGGDPTSTHDAFSYKQHNLPLSHFIDLLQGYFWQLSDRAVFDDTMFKENVDIELNCKMSDVGAINDALKKYGLKFIDDERLADVLVFKDREK